ncbi:MarR family transcriptional regulator [Glaciibacter flavus]|uniref:MarR family transcriptional regulator n=1 Tax=Orlajensenia flava TaxID=2565934 RepID=UPI003B0028F7
MVASDAGYVEESYLRRVTRAHQRLHSATEEVSSQFAAANSLHRVDLEALLAVMNAEQAGSPLTPGQLGSAVHLSSAATTGLIDRLEKAGHLERRRDAVDRRRVHLHYADHAMRMAEGFFRPLGEVTTDLMRQYTPEQLDLILGYLDKAADGMSAHADRLRGGEATE